MVSRIIGVSIPAIRKWRHGEGVAPVNRRALAQILALVDMLSDQFMIDDPASWLEIPLGPGNRTLIDVYLAGRVDIILEYAARWIPSPDSVLAQLDPESHGGQVQPEFETFVAEDGHLGIRRVAPR
jgi:hypothetical protein